MAELWSLLHFVMPALFDSHDEFKEWFSRDIEGHAEGSRAKVQQPNFSALFLNERPEITVQILSYNLFNILDPLIL